MTKFYRVRIDFDHSKKDYQNNYVWLNDKEYKKYKNIRHQLTLLNIDLLTSIYDDTSNASSPDAMFLKLK